MELNKSQFNPDDGFCKVCGGPTSALGGYNNHNHSDTNNNVPTENLETKIKRIDALRTVDLSNRDDLADHLASRAHQRHPGSLNGMANNIVGFVVPDTEAEKADPKNAEIASWKRNEPRWKSPPRFPRYKLNTSHPLFPVHINPKNVHPQLIADIGKYLDQNGGYDTHNEEADPSAMDSIGWTKGLLNGEHPFDRPLHLKELQTLHQHLHDTYDVPYGSEKYTTVGNSHFHHDIDSYELGHKDNPNEGN